MLVISRKQHEFIQIGENILVKVIRTSSGSVKIGIDAPNGVSILRGELADDVGSVACSQRRPQRSRHFNREPETVQAFEAI